MDFPVIGEIVKKIKDLELCGIVDDAYLARAVHTCLHVEVGGGKQIPPFGDSNFLYIYQPSTGVYLSLRKEQIRLLIQNLSGLRVGKASSKKRANYLRLTLSKINSIMTLLHDMCDTNNPKYFNEAKPGLCMTNGFVSIEDGKIVLQPHDPRFRSVYNVGIAYDPDATCPIWDDTLRKIFSNTQDSANCVKCLQQFAGACLIGKATHYTRAILLFGEGSNGKSTIIETLASLFPEDNITYSSPISWGQRFTLARLKNSMLNIAGELPNKKIIATDVFKTVLDGGAVDSEFKGKDHFSLYPRAGHIFSSNFVPQSDDTSLGFWRRLILLPGWYNFNNDPSKLTKEEIVTKLRGEKAGIIAWALRGAVELLAQKDYTIPACSTSLIADIQADTDAVKSWISDSCDISNKESWTGSEDLWNSFKSSSWAENNSYTKIGFSKRLVELGFARRKNQHIQLRGFQGIKIAKRGALEQALIDSPIRHEELIVN
jgi:P4 family phage/plasmid primase-like protien